jgi:hypothetical protein
MSTKPCLTLVAAVSCIALAHMWDGTAFAQSSGKSFSDAATRYAAQLLRDGRQVFRFDTFGSEGFWGGQLKRHNAIQGQKAGGVGPGISPSKRLSLG